MGSTTLQPRGRPTLLTPGMQAKIVEGIGNGNYDYIAARMAGITSLTFRKWVKKGEDSLANDVDDIYSDFVTAVDVAVARGESTVVERLHNHTEKSWGAAVAYLERKHPERWGKQDKVTVEANVNVNTLPIADLTLETKQLILAELKSKTELSSSDPVLEIAGAVVDTGSDVED